MKFEYTKEQKDIIYNDYKKGDVVLVEARAGASKTTTIVGTLNNWEEKFPNRKVLYLVYNSEMKKDADRQMKNNDLEDYVEVKTVHGLAYKFVGSKYRHKLGGSLLKRDIKNELNCDWDSSDKIKNELDNFFNSSKIHSNDLSKEALAYVRKMIDVNDDSVKMTHDCYLKLYSSTINKYPALGYDAIFVDESQDSNDITLDLVMNKISSDNTIKIFVGDPYQQIYSFRGSENIMDVIHPTIRFPLSKSFRFGPEVAKLGSKLIRKEFFGNENINSNIYPDWYYSDIKEQVTHISRTNVGVITSALEMKKRGLSVHFLRGMAEYSNDIMDVCHLFNNELYLIKNKQFLKYKSVKQFMAIAYKSRDSFMMTMCGLLKQHSPKYIIKNVVDMKNNKISKNKADVILSNVHSSKGLEYSSVILGNDFMLLDKITDDTFEELNLIYVAVTRAKNNLFLNEDLSNFYRKIKPTI